MPTVSTTALMPMRMPSIVSAERSRWVRTASNAERKVSRQLMPRGPSGSCRHHRAVVEDLAVVDLHGALGSCGDVSLVGDQHDRAPAGVQLVDEVEHVGGG